MAKFQMPTVQEFLGLNANGMGDGAASFVDGLHEKVQANFTLAVEQTSDEKWYVVSLRDDTNRKVAGVCFANARKAEERLAYYRALHEKKQLYVGAAIWDLADSTYSIEKGTLMTRMGRASKTVKANTIINSQLWMLMTGAKRFKVAPSEVSEAAKKAVKEDAAVKAAA